MCECVCARVSFKVWQWLETSNNVKNGTRIISARYISSCITSTLIDFYHTKCLRPHGTHIHDAVPQHQYVAHTYIELAPIFPLENHRFETYEPAIIFILSPIELSGEFGRNHFAAIVLTERIVYPSAAIYISFPLRRQVIDRKNEVQCKNFQYLNKFNGVFAFEIIRKNVPVMGCMAIRLLRRQFSEILTIFDWVHCVKVHGTVECGTPCGVNRVSISPNVQIVTRLVIDFLFSMAGELTTGSIEDNQRIYTELQWWMARARVVNKKKQKNELHKAET